jgi:uncharacterized repeat protein (TIGR01451 family)/fimbrial isopeptide formation D2 family protein
MSDLNTSQYPAAPAYSQMGRSRRLGITLGATLVLLTVTLLLLNAPRLFALPSETTISQRIQNSVLTSGSAVTATYGEALTVTMRFTVTAGTYLTGPITVTTRFAGWTTPNATYGYRFLGYQGPMTVSEGTPDLTGVNFVSNTTAGITYLTWTFNAIDNTSSAVPAVYEIPYQVRLVWDGIPDTGGTTAIPSTANTTTIAWPGGGGSPKTANNLAVTRIVPNLSAAYSTKNYGGAIQSGGTVVYTVTLKNGNNTTGFSTAYDLVITDSLDSHLTYGSASPAPDSFSSAPGQNTVLTWTATSLAPNTTWVAYVTATLPATFTANAPYLNTVYPSYTTLPDTQPDEATFTDTIVRPVSALVIASKRANPAANVRIGDAVAYTVQFTIPASAGIWSPIFTDTLPDGFRYRAGTFGLTGATLNGAVVTTTSGTKEQIIWKLTDMPPGANAQIFTVIYTADVTGLRTDGSPAYAPPSTGQVNADNAVVGTWQTDTGVPVSLGAALVGRTTIAQPYFNSLSKIIKTWPLGQPEEVGSQVNYEITLINNGTITGYEVALNDVLPPGLVFKQTVSWSPANLVLSTQPSAGDVGTVHWIFQEIPGKTTVKLEFSVIVSDTARPGDTLSNTVTVADYTSQPGDDINPYDRHYSGIVGALPAPGRVGFVLKGLNATKTDSPDPVLPGQQLNYRIVYSNSSALFAATGAQLIDQYDPWLTFQSATVSPTSHDPGNRKLVWDVGTVPINSVDSYITATFTVASAISRSVRLLTNTISSDWSSPAPAMTRIVTTTLVQPKPTISLDDQGAIAQAGKFLTYTLIYSNAAGATGATTGTFTITLGYAEYVSYTTHTSTPASPPGPWLINPDGSVFTDTLGPGISRTIRLRMLVDKPLPYTLDVFTSTATITDRASDASDSESENTPVAIPIFTFYKVFLGNPPVAAGDTLAYRIFVTNTGTVTATNVVITDVWDSNTGPIAANGWTLQPTYGVYTIASLGLGQGVGVDAPSVNVTTTLPANAQVIRNIARLSSAETTRQETSIDTPLVGLYIQKSHDPDPVFPGGLLNYTIVYTAYASAIAAPYITDALPSEVSFVSCSGGESCSFSNGQVIWNWTNMLMNDTGQVNIVVQAPNTEGITLTNRYASDGGGINFREGPPDYTYVGRPHMSITKRATIAVNPIAPGDQIVYTLNYTNSGSYKATTVEVFDILPANTTFVSCGGAVCSESGGTVTWEVGEVAAPGQGALTLIVRVNPNAGTTTIVNGNYYLTADRNVVNENTPPAVSTSVVRPALTVSKSSSSDWIALGGTITYTTQYTNTGGGTFTTLIFTDDIDSRLSILQVSPNCNVNSLQVICTDTNLTPYQSKQFTITVQSVSLSNNDIVTNSVTYLAGNQTETLPEATTLPIEVIATNTGAAANFSGSPISVNIGSNVVFTNLSSGSGIISCLWDFGDTTTSTAACQPGNAVNHAYSLPGTYTVKLTVTTGSGPNTRTRADYVTVSGEATYGVQITSPQPAKSGARGTQVMYTVLITNTGTVPDSFTLSLPTAGTYQWVTQLGSTALGPLAPQQSANAQVTVLIPAAAPLIANDVVTITATSDSSASATSSVVLKTSTLVYRIYLPLILR